MNKFCLLFLAAFIFTTVQSQSAYSFFKPAPTLNSKIDHIAIENPDLIEANNFFMDAESMERSGDLVNAVVMFSRAASSYNDAKMAFRYANTLMRVCNLHILLKNYKVAEDIVLKTTLKIYSRLGNKTGELDAYRHLGRAYFGENKLPESMWFFTQQGIIANQSYNKMAYIESVLSIAGIKIKKQEFSLATADINRAELLSKNSNITAFNNQISESRLLIATQFKK